MAYETKYYKCEYCGRILASMGVGPHYRVHKTEIEQEKEQKSKDLLKTLEVKE